MLWLLLNQHYVSLGFKNLEISVLEEVVSSEAQLVQVLVSGLVSLETMNSVSLDADDFNLIVPKGLRL